MTATDELRRLLDEREVKWEMSIGILSHIKTVWRSGSWEYKAIETSGGEFSVYAEHRDWLTPEQAIAATLGNDGVERSKNGVAERERDQLKAENKQLRELVRLAWECTHTGVSCDDCRLTFGGCTLRSAMRELGVVE